MINGKIVDFGAARSRDHVDISITVRLPRCTGEDWPELHAAIAAEFEKGGTATATGMCEPADEAAAPPISSALVRHMERDADSDDGESVDTSWDSYDSDDGESVGSVSDDDSDGRGADEYE